MVRVLVAQGCVALSMRAAIRFLADLKSGGRFVGALK
jgi:hypothetical protein